MNWGDELSKINDAYLIFNIKTNEIVGVIEADDGRYDFQIAMKMNSLGYSIIRLNFDDLVFGGEKLKKELQIRRATQDLMEGLDDW